MFMSFEIRDVCIICIRLITQVSMRYGEIFHEPKASDLPYLAPDECNKCFILRGTPSGSFSH